MERRGAFSDAAASLSGWYESHDFLKVCQLIIPSEDGIREFCAYAAPRWIDYASLVLFQSNLRWNDDVKDSRK